MLTKTKPEAAKELIELAQQDADIRYTYYKALSQIDYSKKEEGEKGKDEKEKKDKITA